MLKAIYLYTTRNGFIGKSLKNLNLLFQWIKDGKET